MKQPLILTAILTASLAFGQLIPTNEKQALLSAQLIYPGKTTLEPLKIFKFSKCIKDNYRIPYEKMKWLQKQVDRKSLENFVIFNKTNVITADECKNLIK